MVSASRNRGHAAVAAAVCCALVLSACSEGTRAQPSDIAGASHAPSAAIARTIPLSGSDVLDGTGIDARALSEAAAAWCDAEGIDAKSMYVLSFEEKAGGAVVEMSLPDGRGVTCACERGAAVEFGFALSDARASAFDDTTPAQRTPQLSPEEPVGEDAYAFLPEAARTALPQAVAEFLRSKGFETDGAAPELVGAPEQAEGTVTFEVASAGRRIEIDYNADSGLFGMALL